MERNRARGWIAVLAVAAVWAGSATPVQAGRDEASAVYKNALRAYRAGDLPRALSLFEQSENEDPTYPFPTLALGRIYHELFEQGMRHYDDSAEAYGRFQLQLQAHPPGPTEQALYQGRLFQGQLYLKGGDYAKALLALEDFLRLQPRYTNLETIYNGIGIAHYYLGQYDRAVGSFRAALAADPDFAEARFNLRSVFTRLAVYNEAVAISRAGDLETALAKLERLREVAPNYLPGQRLEAKVLAALGRPDEALGVYAKVLAGGGNDPSSYGVRLDMAKMLVLAGRTAEAIALLEENQRRFPSVSDDKARREGASLLRALGAAQ